MKNTTETPEINEFISETPAVETPSIVTPSIVREPSVEAFESRTKSEQILTVVEVIPTSGSNMGKQMYVINGKHWSRQAPKPEENTVVLHTVLAKDGKVYWNVQGYGIEARALTIDQKIAKLTSFDAGYSMAIAALLK